MQHRRDPIDDLSRIDPIDGERLAASWSDSPASKALFEEITAMPVDTRPRMTETTLITRPDSRPARKRAVRLAAGLAVVAAALAVTQGALSGGSRAFAVRQLPNGVIEIDAVAEFRDGEALAAELREFGIDVNVTTVPSSPSAVGGIAVFLPGGGDYIPEGVTYGGPDGTPEVFKISIDPNRFTEHVTIEFHVAAGEGERYQLAQEVFEPGEVLGGLHCALGEPLRAEALVPYLADVGLDPVWLVITPTSDPSITNSRQVDEVPAGRVFAGYARDSATVEFQVVPDGVTLSDIHRPHFSDVACTPQQAAEWANSG